MSSSRKPWLVVIVDAITRLGGEAHYEDLYREIKSRHASQLTKEWEATVRRTIETHSSDSDNFTGKDVFYSVEGKGRGVWGLRNFNADDDSDI